MADGDDRPSLATFWKKGRDRLRGKEAPGEGSVGECECRAVLIPHRSATLPPTSNRPAADPQQKFLFDSIRSAIWGLATYPGDPSIQVDKMDTPPALDVDSHVLLNHPHHGFSPSTPPRAADEETY